MVRLLFDTFCIILTVHFAWLLGTHAVRCYVLGRPVRLPTRLTSRAGLGEVFATFCQELAGLLLLSLLWPFPVRRLHLPRAVGGRLPLLLIPGYGIQRSGMLLLSWWLRQKGWSTVIAPLGPSAGVLGSASRSVEELASRLSLAVDQVAAATGATQVLLIGQGLGGVVARYYVEQMEMGSRVASLITLGTAHRGTGLAVFGQGLIEALLPGSPLIGALEASLATIAVPYVSISADLDACVIPPTSSVLGPPHQDVHISGIGHHSLLFSARTFRAVREHLVRIAQDDVTEGMTRPGSEQQGSPAASERATEATEDTNAETVLATAGETITVGGSEVGPTGSRPGEPPDESSDERDE